MTVSAVLRALLARWVAGEIRLTPEEHSREELVALAGAAQGMWAARDPDTYIEDQARSSAAVSSTHSK